MWTATAFAGLDTQGLLLKGFEPSVSWNSLGTQSLPADKSYTPTGVTLMAALAYNKKKVTAPPTTWQQLLSSQWKGQVGMNDPSQSGPTFPFIAGMMNYLGGVSAGETYFTKLKANGLVSRPIMMAWLFTFCGVFLELPLSQLLYAPGSPPASIAIEDNLSNYHFGVGMVQAVLAVAIALAAVGVVLGGYRLLAPAGWRRIGSAIGGGRG